jgi:hypothetical protein
MTTIEPGVTGRRRPGAIKRRRKTGSETMSVPEAGKKYFNLSKNAAYDAAARGDIPVVQVGKLKRVPVRLMERLMDEAGKSDSAA